MNSYSIYLLGWDGGYGGGNKSGGEDYGQPYLCFFLHIINIIVPRTLLSFNSFFEDINYYTSHFYHVFRIILFIACKSCNTTLMSVVKHNYLRDYAYS